MCQTTETENRTAQCKWCGETFTPTGLRFELCGTLNCTILEDRFTELVELLEEYPELESFTMKHFHELSQKIANQNELSESDKRKLWNHFFEETKNRLSELSPIYRQALNFIRCKWCGQKFTPKSHNSQTCDSEECLSTRRRYRDLKKRLNSYPIILQVHEEIAEQITLAASEGCITTSILWKDLFEISDSTIAYVKKFQRG